MRCLLALGLAAAAACKFTPPSPVAEDARGEDAPMDTPPPVPEVRFTSVTVDATALRPGLYGLEVTAVVKNELAVEVTGLRASLSFAEGSTDRAADFRWRDADARDGVMEPQPASIAPGGEATLRFRVDALASAAPLAAGSAIRIGGEAVFQHEGMTRSVTPLEPPSSVPFAALPDPIVVTTAEDEDNGNGLRSLREALILANADPGFDRIVFDPIAFPESTQTVTVLRENLGELPAVAGELVIDASRTRFVLAADSNWESPAGRYGLRVQSGKLVAHGVAFRDMGHNYPLEDVSSNNCGTNVQHDGGAIRVDGGTLILDGSLFADTGVNERNCYAASVRIHGGAGHRILNSRWTDQSMDAIYINAAAREVSGNVMDAGNNPGKVDECIFVQSQGNADLWIVGNLCVDQEYSAVVASGDDAGVLYVVHNTFARNRDLGAVRRAGSNTRRIELHNNAYQANAPAAISTTNNGSGFTISHESELGGGVLCSSCTAATLQMATITEDMDLRFTNPGGTTPAHFTPQAGSPLVDSGLDLLDRNGPAPGRFNGAGPERGAVELP